MKAFVCFALFVAAASAYEMPALYSKYSMTGTPGVDSFFAIPRTVSEATEQGWVQPEETLGNKLIRTFCETDDPRICTLFDNKDSICGYQISIPAQIAELNIPGIFYPEKGFKELTLFGQKMFSNQIFFVSQEVIQNGGRNYNNQTGTGLWLQAGEELTNTPLNETDMKNTQFRRQNCFIRMGQHWFWLAQTNMTQKEFMPWFTLFDDNEELSGFGFIAFGANGDFYKGATKTPWFENVPAAAIKAIAPSTPQWVFDNIDTYGIIAHHVYFGKQPWNIKCKAASPKISNY